MPIITHHKLPDGVEINNIARASVSDNAVEIEMYNGAIVYSLPCAMVADAQRLCDKINKAREDWGIQMDAFEEACVVDVIRLDET